MNALELVQLPALMERTTGRSDITIGLLDGPVAMSHPDLADAPIREVPGRLGGTCTQPSSAACLHGTFTAGMLSAKRSSPAPAICPHCTLLVRPIFAESASEESSFPSATSEELAVAIIEIIKAGARVLNISAALIQPVSMAHQRLDEALDYAAQRGAIVVAAAGNQGSVGSSVITRHPWVIPVAACDGHGRPLTLSNLGHSIGRRGLSAPGTAITSLGADSNPITSGGTSAAAPFVTGAIALLWSEFPAAPSVEVKLAVTHTSAQRRTTVVPPLLNAWAAYQMLVKIHTRR